jgi:RNA:NAD 2'-phosphotransferase (TPT1/KptA family)
LLIVHSKHYCCVCSDNDSSHFASSCPNSTIVYHGTSEERAKLIKSNGWKLSPARKDVGIGEGVYFTPDFDVAKKIGIGRYGSDNWAVI